MAKYDPVYETALEHIDTSSLSRAGSGVHLQIHSNYAFITIRINATDTKSVNALKGLKLTLPGPLSMSGSIKSALFLWISPDEYLLVVKRRSQDQWLEKLTQALARRFAAAVDSSGTYTMLELQGDKITEALSKIINYDLKVNCPKRKVVSTLAGAAPVVLLRPEAQSIHLLVRFSFSAYLYEMLEHASREYIN